MCRGVKCTLAVHRLKINKAPGSDGSGNRRSPISMIQTMKALEWENCHGHILNVKE